MADPATTTATPGGDPNAGQPPAAGDPNAPPANPPAADPNAAAATAPQRPDHIPEKFWDAEKGAPRVDDMAKSYAELERWRGERTSNVPEQYERPGFLKEHADAGIKVDDVVGQLEQIARTEGYSQQGFEGLVKALLPDPGEHRERHQAALKEMFGDAAESTLQAVGTFANTLTEPHAKEVAEVLLTFPAGVKFLDDMRLKSAQPGLPGSQENPGGGRLTQQDLDAKMRDPRYWREKDPSFIAEVTRGFQELYGSGQVRTAAQNPGEIAGSSV